MPAANTLPARARTAEFKLPGTDRFGDVPARPAAYARISETDDIDDFGGVDRQQGLVNAYCREWGWPEPVWYIDNDITAADPSIERPEYLQMLAAIDAGEHDGVIGLDYDRITRQPLEAEQLIAVCERRGVRHVVGVRDNDNLDAVGGAGLLVFRVKAAVNAEEIRKMKKRLREFQAERAEKGLPSGGGYRPLCYSCSPRTKPPKCSRKGCRHDEVCRARLAERAAKVCTIPGCVHDGGMSLIPREKEAVQRVAVMVLNGVTLGAAGRWLTENGVYRVNGSKEWTETVLRQVLVSPRIAGLREHNPKDGGRRQLDGTGRADWPEAVWPAVIDLKTWHQLRALFADRTRRHVLRRRHLLAGHIDCGLCENPLVGTRLRHRRGHEIVRYGCRAARGGCGRLSTEMGFEVEDQVVETVGEWLANPDFAANLAGVLRGDDGIAVERITAEIDRLEAELRQAVRDRRAGKLDDVEWDELRGLVSEDLHRARADLAKARRQAAASAPLGTVTVERLAEVWSNLEELHETDPDLADLDPVAFRREVIGALVGELVLNPAGRGARQWTPDRVTIRPAWETAAT